MSIAAGIDNDDNQRSVKSGSQRTSKSNKEGRGAEDMPRWIFFFFFVVLNGLRGKREKEKRTHQTKKGSNLRSKSQLEGKFVVEPVSGSVWSV